MKSDLHNELQNKAWNYIHNKSYWISSIEVPTPLGICDVWGLSRVLDYVTIAIEVKVSRSDFRSLSQRAKEEWSRENPMGNTNYILCPAELIKPKEVNDNWGLLWWNGERIVNKKQAKFIEMTDRQKLEILISFLDNGWNDKRPKLIS